MTNAWIQRLTVLISSLLALWGAVFYWQQSRFGWVLLSLAMPALVTAAVLAIQCVMSALVNRGERGEKASAGQWLRAWLAEWRIVVLVFGWWQPFGHRSWADQLQPTPGRRGMILVHGYSCNRALWTGWMRRLHRDGRAFVALDLEPARGSISEYAALIEAAVVKIEEMTGLPPVLVGHSMGGLAIRAWAAQAGSMCMTRVHRIITIGTPHYGTWIARFSFATNGREMRLQSPWLGKNASRLPDDFSKKCICFYSNCDNIVFPAKAAILPGADNRFLAGRAHVELALLPEIQETCWAQLSDEIQLSTSK